MMKSMGAHVRLKMVGSGCTSMSGAEIKDIQKKVQEDAEKMKNGLQIIEGGGNSLEEEGEETVKEVVSIVKAVERKNKKVGVVGVLRRP